MNILEQDPRYPQVLEVCKRLSDKGYTAYLAGGCVRDGLLGRTPKDFDVATNARPEEIESLFEKTVGIGKQFGIIVVVLETQNIEVATFRKDGPYSDGRRPDGVVFVDAKEDALRRDFTINALFWDPLQKKIYDYANGKEDLGKKLIRAVGNANQRFEEDKLRILRAVRFQAELGFSIEASTLEAVVKRASEVVSVSAERMRDEIEKLLNGNYVTLGLKSLMDTGLARVILGESLLVGFDSGKWIASIAAVKSLAVRRLLFWSMGEGQTLIHDRLLKYKYSSEKSREVTGLLSKLAVIRSPGRDADVMKLFDASSYAAGELSSLKELLELRLNTHVREPHKETFVGAKLFMDLFAKSYKKPAPFLTGKDLLAAGLPAGAQLGKVLAAVEADQLEGLLKSKEEALASAIRMHSCLK